MEIKLTGVILILVYTCIISDIQGYKNHSLFFSKDIKRYLQKFWIAPLTVVKFANEKCTVETGIFGTCLTRPDCLSKGGSTKQDCALGFGVCCVITARENGAVTGNNTLIKKASFNSGEDISYTVNRISKDICQYRLDVVSLDMYKVPINGICDFDWMTVSQDDKFDKVCGVTKNIHYYIDVTDDVTFTFHTDPSVTYFRDWEIYVSQYTCNMGAPHGCGQWYLGKSGKIDIWNNIEQPPEPWYYINNQKYAICVRWEAGYCSITYNEATRFQPRCNDLFERPAEIPGTLRAACIFTPPNNAVTYTYGNGAQSFSVNFNDNTNEHEGAALNPYKNPSISYTQNSC